MPPRKRQEVVRAPQVLLLHLVRWRGRRAGVRGLLHHVAPDETLRLPMGEADASYALRGVVCHCGPSIHAGHFLAWAHHPTREGDSWWR